TDRRTGSGLRLVAFPLEAGLLPGGNEVVTPPVAFAVYDHRLEVLVFAFTERLESCFPDAMPSNPVAPAVLVGAVDTRAGVGRAAQRLLKTKVVHFDDSRTGHQ